MVEEARLPDQLYRFKDPRQRRIYDDLHRLIGPGPAEFYKDACQLMDSPQLLESTTHLVGHLLREIESAIRDVLTPVAQRLADQEAQHGEDKASRLKFQEGQEFDNLPLEDINVIVKALQQQEQSAGKFTLEVEFKNLDNDYLTLRILKEGDTHKQKIRAIFKALEIRETDRVALAWLRLVDRRNEYRLHKVAHRDTLRRPRPITEEFQRVWEEMQDVLSEVLQRLQDRYLTIFEILDDLSKNPAPTKRDFKMLETAVPQNPVTLDYFFSRCKNPKWLGYLEQRVVKGSLLQSEAYYLAQMAAHHPQKVREIILQTSDIYGPPYVVVTLADAVLNMPPDIAAQLVDKAKGWASPSSLDPLLADKLGALITHLAQSGQPKEALSLAGTLLEVLPDPTVKDKLVDGDVLEEFFTPSPKPKAKLDPWHYEELLKKHGPRLIRAGGMETLKLLCDLLDKALCFSQRRKEDKPDDYSRVWRPAVEEHSHNIKGDLKDALVDSIRNAAELLVREELAPLPEGIEQLESRVWPIFHRIALHLLGRFPEKAPGLVVNHLMDRSHFSSPNNLMHEYALLLREHFKTLTPDQQRAILNWIDQGPDLSWMGSGVPAKEVEQRKKSWQLRRLTWIKDDLTRKWKKRYEILVDELGALENPEFPVGMSTGWIRPISPKTPDELQAMDVREIVKFLKTWKPTGDLGFEPAPEPEGLGRSLAKAVSQSPERFAAMAREFQGLDPTYVRAVISGLHEAAKHEKAFDWEPVLGLGQWVVNQPREIVGRIVKRFEADPHWGWTRKGIARLLQVGFDKDLIDFNLRSKVWKVLLPITDDPDPSTGDESRSDLNALDLAINTARGEAIDAVIHYAIWVRRHLKKLPDGKERVDHGSTEITEVREVLEKHLDPKHEPSVAVHSIYGLEFPRLVLLDPEWAKQKASQIFPLEESQLVFWEATWRAYIVYNQPYSNVFKLLRSQYVFAIEHVDISEEKQRSPGDPDEQLAQHLMVFYWRGEIDLDNPLFSHFWEQAPSSLRKDALGFIGRGLRGTKGEVSPEILGRLKHLWEKRLELAKRDLEHHKSEITAFGWWFISRKFENDWAIAQLLEVLSITLEVERAHSVIEQLATLVDRMPLQCIRCLRAIVEGDREGWKVLMVREHVRTILSTALYSSDNKAAEEAKKLINYLGSRGYLEFRNLLKPE